MTNYYEILTLRYLIKTLVGHYLKSTNSTSLNIIQYSSVFIDGCLYITCSKGSRRKSFF